MITPGPWKTRMAKDFVGMVWEGEGHPFTVISDRGTVVCKGGMNGKEETEANAQAIAALPDLIEAAKAIVSGATPHSGKIEITVQAYSALCNALNKADKRREE